jgi:hypothetical protein
LAAVVAARDDAEDTKLLQENRVGTDGPALLEFFKKRVVRGDDAARLKALVRKLGDDDFDVRETASKQLVAEGARARPFLQEAVSDPDVEVSRRSRECLEKIDRGTASVVVATAARVLAKQRPAGAAEALLEFLPQADDDSVAEAVREALAALATREGKPEPALVASLADKLPARRAAAAVALAPLVDQRAAVCKLLADDDPTVRLRAGLALTRQRDKGAVDVLIALLDQQGVRPQDLGAVEDLLCRLAADKAPSLPSGEDAAARKKYREAWQAWWREAGPQIDVAKLAEASHALGYTLVLLLDQGKAMELDAANKPRVTYEGLAFPLDIQFLPGDRILTAEHNDNRVTERNAKGEVVWERKVDQPLVAQRLPSGNTFIATRTQLTEVTKEGKEVFNYTRPDGATIMRAEKLRNGDIALVTQLGATRFILLSSTGKELRSFGVNVSTSGGRIQVLSNGHVMVPENHANRVVEMDATGKEVWQATVDQPIAAVRLPNGHTLVTSMSTDVGAVELDRNGRQVWQYKADTRVTRAYRR